MLNQTVIATAVLTSALILSSPLHGICADERPAQQPNPDIGRYQMLEGQFAVSTMKGNEASERSLFKIDTATGEVWIGKQMQYLDKKTGRIVQQRYWEPFEHYLEAVQQTLPNK